MADPDIDLPADGDQSLLSDRLVTPAGMERHAFKAMGTTVEILLPAGQVDEVTRIKDLFLA